MTAPKILMVLTSHDQLGTTKKKTGFWLEEFVRYPVSLRAEAIAPILAPTRDEECIALQFGRSGMRERHRGSGRTEVDDEHRRLGNRGHPVHRFSGIRAHRYSFSTAL